MTLKNEIFEGLGAATAAKKLVYDPRDDYYEQIAEAAKAENQRRKQQEAERVANKTASQQGGPSGPASRYAIPAGTVPTAASVKTPQAPTVPGMPAPDQQASAGPSYGGGLGTSYPPSIVEPDFGSRAARGGRIGKPRLRAIRTNFRHGGPVTPNDDDDDDEFEEFVPRPHFGEEDRELPPEPGAEGSPRNPQFPRYRDPAIIQEPAEDDPEFHNPYQRDPEPGADRPFPARARRYDLGGPVEGEEDNEADLIVQGILQRDLAGRPGMAVPRRAGPMSSTPSPADRMRALAQRPGGQTAMTTEPPTSRGFQGSPNLSSRTGADETGFEGSPVISPPLSSYTPPRVTGEDVARPPMPRLEDSEFAGQAGMPQPYPRADVRPKPVFDPRSEPAPVNSFAEGPPPPQEETSSKLGRWGAENRARYEINQQILALQRKRQEIDPSVFAQTTEAQRQQAQQETAQIDQQIAALRAQAGGPAPVGAGVGVGPGGTQTAAAAPPTGPTGTTTSRAPPPAGGANAPSTAPKEGAQAMRTLPMWAERANPLDVPGLYSAPPARAGGGGGGGGTAGGGTAVQTGAPPRLAMSDPNRTAAYNPADINDVMDPTRRRTNEELAQVLTGATTQMPLGPNGQMPAVGQGAVSRHVGQAYVARNDQGGRWEPGEAILRGMLSDYKTFLSQGRLEEANKMAAGLIQYANLEASSHAHVAEDLVRQGDFYGALRNVVSAAGYLPDGMQHKVGADGKSVDTIDPRTGKVTANTPVDGRWLLAAIGGFKNGDLLWATLQAAVQSTKVDKNAEGRALSNLIRRNTLKLQGQRLARGPGGGRGRAGPAAMSETEKRLAQIRANLGGATPPGTGEQSQPAQGGGEDTSDEVNPPLESEENG